jgi:hypothetical protein
MPEPRFIQAQQLLRQALIVLSTDPDEHDDAAENGIWEDLLDVTERLEAHAGLEQLLP